MPKFSSRNSSDFSPSSSTELSRRRFLQSSAAAGALAIGGVSPLLRAQQGGPLITKAIPSTGEQLPVIGFGTNQYGTGEDPSIRADLLESLGHFKAFGAKVIDSSSHYRGSEAMLGQLLAELDIKEQAFISTKAGQRGDEALPIKFDTSLQRLGVDQIEVYQVHNAVFQDWRNMLPQLHEWKQEGLIRYLGITGSEQQEHSELAQIMRTEALDFIQIDYNLLSRNIENEILPIARDKGIAVLGNVPYAQGQLFSLVSGVELPDFAKEFGCQSWGNFFLKYNISHPDITASIPGTTKPHHALDNLTAGTGRLPTAAERRMQEEFISQL